MPGKRVLLIAEAANPEWVSVPLVGWSLATALRQISNVHIVTQIRNRDAFLRAGLVEGVDFTAIDTEELSRPLWKFASILRMGKGKGWTMATAIASLSYYYFEIKVWKKFGADIRNGNYDLVHRITPLSPTAVSSLAAKCDTAGVPFLIGPLNGGVPWPKGFDSERRREREWLSYIRSAYKLMPGRNAMLKHSRVIFVGSQYTKSEIPDIYHNKCVYIPENAVDPAKFRPLLTAPDDGPLRACFIGRLVPYKGPDMLLEAALPLLATGALEIDIIGDGPLRTRLEFMVRDHALQHRVVFHGWLPHANIPGVAGRNHIFAFPSVREFGGGAVMEAMALGIVPVVVDYAGPGEIVDDKVGFKIPLGTRASIIDSLRITLETISADRSSLADLSRAGIAKTRTHFTWEQKARKIYDVYNTLDQQHSCQ